MPAETTRPLSALLSQVLVAFTLELDDEFEKQMRESGYAGASLSVVIWSTLMRLLAGASPSVRDLSVRDFSVRDLAAQSLSSEKRVKFELGGSFFNILNHPNFGLPNEYTFEAFGQMCSAGTAFGCNALAVQPTTPYGAFQGAGVEGRLIQVHGRISF